MGAAGAHRYWRINVVSGYYATEVRIPEVELRTRVGGADVTTSGTTVAASSFISSTFAPAKAVDGSTSTYWVASGTPAGKWLSFDLVSAAPIAEVAIYQDATKGPKNVQIAYSDDGTTFTTCTDVVTLTQTGGWKTIGINQTTRNVLFIGEAF